MSHARPALPAPANDTRHTGFQLVLELYGCDRAALADAPRLRNLLREAAEAAGAQVTAGTVHPAGPGHSAIVLLPRGHLALHTYPENGYAAADLCLGAAAGMEEAGRVLAEGLGSARPRRRMILRGDEG